MERVIATWFFGLLTLPAALFALGSFFLLDIPWADDGVAVVLIWLLIADAWVLVWALSIAAKATWTQRWSFYRAALLPAGAVVGHVVLIGVAYMTLPRCILWCNSIDLALA